MRDEVLIARQRAGLLGKLWILARLIYFGTPVLMILAVIAGAWLLALTAYLWALVSFALAVAAGVGIAVYAASDRLRWTLKDAAAHWWCSSVETHLALGYHIPEAEQAALNLAFTGASQEADRKPGRLRQFVSRFQADPVAGIERRRFGFVVERCYVTYWDAPGIRNYLD